MSQSPQYALSCGLSGENRLSPLVMVVKVKENGWRWRINVFSRDVCFVCLCVGRRHHRVACAYIR